METHIKYFKKPPKLNNPVLIEGLPGFGQVGRLAAEHIIKEFKGKKFAELYSPHFPPQVMIRNDGFVDILSNNFYYIKNKKLKRDIVVVVGEAQAATITGQYEVCEKIVEAGKKLGIKEIITIGGYATGMLLKVSKVYGAATEKKLIEEFADYGVIFKTKGDRGGIVGASGILLGIGMLNNIPSICLMGETPGHPLLIDAKAAEAVLRAIGKKLKVEIDMGELDKRAKELEKFRLGLERMMKKMVKKEEGGKKEEEEAELKYIG